MRALKSLRARIPCFTCDGVETFGFEIQNETDYVTIFGEASWKEQEKKLKK